MECFYLGTVHSVTAGAVSWTYYTCTKDSTSVITSWFIDEVLV